MARNKGGLRFQPSGGARGPAIPVGKKQRLTIERLAHDGRGIAHEAGMTWFVSGGLPGEELEARVLGARSKVVDARSERLFSSSDLRRREPCTVAGRCGGCTLAPGTRRAVGPEAAYLAGAVAAFRRDRAGRMGRPLVGPEFGYRRRARIAVRWDARARRLDVGFRASASQEIVAFDECLVLVPPLQTIARALPALLQDFRKPESIGHVELFHGTASALLLRHTTALVDEDRQRLAAFCSAHQAQLWLQGAEQPLPVEPAAELGYSLGDWQLTLAYQPGDFVQVNAPVNESMIRQALDWLAPTADERVLDLFCGLGNFSLPLARRVARVVGVEGVAAMVERAGANALANGLGNAHFFQADLSKALAEAPWAEQGFTAVLLDPPRDGAFEAVREMSSLGARRVVYVSCNPATLARDAGEMARQGYRLKRAGILDMFPQTAHVEAMALFEAG